MTRPLGPEGADVASVGVIRLSSHLPISMSLSVSSREENNIETVFERIENSFDSYLLIVCLCFHTVMGGNRLCNWPLPTESPDPARTSLSPTPSAEQKCHICKYIFLKLRTEFENSI